MDIVDQIKDVADGHENDIKQGIDLVADFIDGKTDGAYGGQVDQAQDLLKDQLDR